jgi:hypothetical protein
MLVVIETHVMLDDVVPMNNRIDRTELFASSFNLAEEPFDFTVSMRMFYASDDVL